MNPLFGNGWNVRLALLVVLVLGVVGADVYAGQHNISQLPLGVANIVTLVSAVVTVGLALRKGSGSSE